jgi:GH43 family beta-xylosidase
MNYIIPESRINQIIFAYLDSLNMDVTYAIPNIKFLNGDYYALVYNTKYMYLDVSPKFFNIIRNMFGLNEERIENILSSWVEQKLGVEILSILNF